ncbi:hypothetical protein CQ12_40560 [Bradyrhizobium jicamae]|uniref:Uncharacterized protein n=1 Tax=Bradyrhizobium jicamae TaxID=280332 RepID=A0A0R3M8V4_9BRAD|nr:hypothetical protein CQ12_40560 [Bradyrhizobium jicamae]
MQTPIRKILCRLGDKIPVSARQMRIVIDRRDGLLDGAPNFHKRNNIISTCTIRSIGITILMKRRQRGTDCRVTRHELFSASHQRIVVECSDRLSVRPKIFLQFAKSANIVPCGGLAQIPARSLCVDGLVDEVPDTLRQIRIGGGVGLSPWFDGRSIGSPRLSQVLLEALLSGLPPSLWFQQGLVRRWPSRQIE